jgi:hypothetical protein
MSVTWIPAADRLPDDELTVLIALKDSDEPVWLGYHDADGWYSADGMPQKENVTHWAPMPEAPRK